MADRFLRHAARLARPPVSECRCCKGLMMTLTSTPTSTTIRRIGLIRAGSMEKPAVVDWVTRRIAVHQRSWMNGKSARSATIARVGRASINRRRWRRRKPSIRVLLAESSSSRWRTWVLVHGMLLSVSSKGGPTSILGLGGAEVEGGAAALKAIMHRRSRNSISYCALIGQERACQKICV